MKALILKRWFLHTVCLLLFCNFALATETLIDFKPLNLTQAGKSGKKIMVSFTAEWCQPCSRIEDSLYNDSEIAELVNENFEPVLVDVDSELGDSWGSEYNINFLPGILFTNSTGIEFERIKKEPTRDEFLSTLKRVIAKEAVPFREHNHPSSITAQPVAISHSSITPISSPSVDKPTPSEDSPTATVISNAIQLGAFSSFENAQRKVEELSMKELGSYIILEEETQGVLYYKVIRKLLLSEEVKTTLRQYHERGHEAFIRTNTN